MLIIEFTGPDSAAVQWQSNQPGYGNGMLNEIRLTGQGGHTCGG